MNRYLLSTAAVALAAALAVPAAAVPLVLPSDGTPVVFNADGTQADPVTTAGNGVVDVNSGVDYTFAGTVSGAGSLSQIGLGNLILGAANSFTDLGINQGTVTLGNNTAAGIGTIAINDNATLAAGANNLVVANGIATTASGLVDAGAAGNVLTLSGNIFGSGSISQVGAGTLVLSGDNSFTNLGINSGTVALGSNTAAGIGAIAINNDATLAAGANNLVIANGIATTGNGLVDAGAAGNVLTLAGNISGPGSISQVGAGNLVLNGNNSFTNLGINQGTVTLGSDTAAGAGAIAINNDATLAAGANNLVVANAITTTANGIVNAGAAGNVFTLGGDINGAGSISQVGEGNLVLNGNNSFTNLGINAGTVTLGSNTAAGSGAIAINNNATLAAGANNLVIANGITTTANGIVNAGAAGNVLTLNGNINGAGSISQVGAGNLVLNGNNSFNNLGINAGTVTVGTNTAAGSGAIAINNNATLAAGANNLVIANGIVTTANGIVDAGPAGNVMTLNGGIIGAGSISQVGAGNLVLNGNNSFTNLGINQGTVTLGSNTAAGSGAIAINNDATLAAGANNLVVANAITTTANGIVNAGGAGNVFTLSGNINGAGSISQVGAGNLVLSGANSFVNLGINQGTVTLGSNTAAGSGQIAINNNATLAAGANNLVIGNAIASTANGIVNAGGAGNVFTLNGNIIGPGSISQVGAGNLVLNGNNSFTNLGINQGTVTLGSNTAGGSANIAINNNATLAAGKTGLVVANAIQTTGNGFINSGTGVFTLSGVISDAGSITKTGAGTLILTGKSIYTGSTTVAAGTLLVNGSTLNSAAFVNSGATLGGTGAVGSLLVRSGGIVAPGNSIGTLSVSGPYSQAAGGIYAVELGASGVGDRINVAGTATLASGAIANVINTNLTPFALGSRWTILSSGGLTGTFTLTGATRVSQFISVFATYDARNAYLNVGQTSSFVSAADTPNQAAAASGVDSAGNGALYQAIAYLPDAASAQDAFDQISGELHATVNSATFEDSRFVREAIYNHTADQFMPGMGLWVGGFGSWGGANSDGNAAEYNRSIGGFFLGFDALKTDVASVGVLTGYSTADINIPDRRSTASTDDLYVGLYGSYDVAGFSLTGAVTNTWRWVKSQRSIAFQGYTDSAQADYSINTFQVFGEAAYQFRFNGFGIEPYANFAYVSVSSNSFAEFGGPAALTSTEDGGSDYWTTNLGLRASYGLPVFGDTFQVSASGGWRYVFEGDTLSPVTMRFASGPNFTVTGAPIAQNAFAATFNVSKKLGDRADFDIGYSGQYGDGWNDSGVRAALRLRF